ncbi:putative leucine-rich repeat domain, L domain-containing protein [Medicago truncatula]|nr:putative leucine-rich repeat domain, L domain-containing protein [Medicago truncatula]
MSALSSSINQMQKLEKLYIIGVVPYTFIDLDLNSPPPKLPKLPEWISKLQNLVKLKVNLPKPENDAMKLLQSMPNLLSLTFAGGGHRYEDNFESLHFQEGLFMNLKKLYLADFHELSHILIDEGALGSLKKLTLWYIPQLMTLPTGIQHLHELQVLRLHYMSEELRQSIAPDEGKERWIFNQVPSVEILK